MHRFVCIVSDVLPCSMGVYRCLDDYDYSIRARDPFVLDTLKVDCKDTATLLR